MAALNRVPLIPARSRIALAVSPTFSFDIDFHDSPGVGFDTGLLFGLRVGRLCHRNSLLTRLSRLLGRHDVNLPEPAALGLAGALGNIDRP